MMVTSFHEVGFTCVLHSRFWTQYSQNDMTLRYTKVTAFL